MQSDNLSSFESILNDKLEQITARENDLSEIRYSVTKNDSLYTGVLIIDSQKGKFFATATSNDTHGLNQSLTTQITKQIKMFGQGLIPQLRAI